MENTYWDKVMRETAFYHAFQPIIDLTNDRLYGYEVLLRSEGLQNPELLFNYAKEQNKLFQLDLKSIFKAFTTFDNEIAHFNGLRLFVNIYPSTLIDPAFHYSLERLTASINISPCSIVFEVNEAEKGSDLTALKESILHLKKQGFFIALDDVGIGDSSLRTIIEIEPNIAKFDRYFTINLATSTKKQKILKVMLEYFKHDETAMILEGIEYEEDLQAAKELGVTLGQGFLLGRPQPLEDYIPTNQKR